MAVVFFIDSCSTEKNTATTRAYHNITSHYNVYFNGYFQSEKYFDKYSDEIRNLFTFESNILNKYNFNLYYYINTTINKTNTLLYTTVSPCQFPKSAQKVQRNTMT